MKKETFLPSLMKELHELGYLHKLDDGAEAPLLWPAEENVMKTGYYARILNPYDKRVLSHRFFIPIHEVLNDPWFWYALALYLRINTDAGGHCLLWIRFVERRCCGQSNLQALYEIVTTYANPR